MKNIEITEVTQEKYDESLRIVIDAIRTKYPKLDLRQGTVLRDLLVSPDATINAWFSEQAEEQRNSSSLLLLRNRYNEGEEISEDDVNAILSNFNMKSISGTKSKGKIRIVTSKGSDYFIPEGFQFSTTDGLLFNVLSDSDISQNPSGETGVKLYKSASGDYFILQVECDEAGAIGNIQQGTGFTPVSSTIFGMTNAYAFDKFSGGSDIEDLDATINRIPESLSIRAFTSNTATEASLRDRFDETDHPIIEASCCGYGNPAQRRDKHNLLGVAVGGRVDVYVRNFTDMPIQTITKTGTKISDGTYSIHLSSEDVAGLYCIRQISDNNDVSLSSYEYSVAYTPENLSSTWHDIDVSKNASEVVGSIWRGADLIISGVIEEEDTEEPHEFKIEVVRLPYAKEIQDLFDSDELRNTGSDFIVRCPMICNVSINATVRYKLGESLDIESLKTALMDYVNTKGFVGRLTRSEIDTVLLNNGCTSVDMFTDGMLHGYVYDAFGKKYDLRGDALDANNIKSYNGMLTKDTMVFVVENQNIQLTAIPTK